MGYSWGGSVEVGDGTADIARTRGDGEGERVCGAGDKGGTG